VIDAESPGAPVQRPSQSPAFATYLDGRRAMIERALDRFLPAGGSCPDIVSRSMRYSVFAGGKRFRPILTLASAEAVASRLDPPVSEASALELALPAACAVEVIHTYSLVHDDLPAMDDDTMRRGRPTAHVVFGEGMAILAGDALLTEAFHLLAREPADAHGALAGRKLEAIRLIARAAGPEGMVGGQALDLGAAATKSGGVPNGPPSGQVDADALGAVHARKTGALIRAAARVGAVMVGGSRAAVEAIDAYAAELGLAFQIVDDILDVEGTPDEIGKTPRKDAVAGKVTYPALHGVEESRRRAEACVERGEAILAAAGLGGRLVEIARWVVRRRH
jgi:geranylgeranyl diphosphate synthase type II